MLAGGEADRVSQPAMASGTLRGPEASMSQQLRSSLVVCVLGALVACSGKSEGDSGAGGGGEDTAAAGVDPSAWSVAEKGPYNLGHTSTTVAYTTALGTSREILVHVWYPTEDTTGEDVRYDAVFADPVSLGEATPIAPVHADGYPVLVHSHGYWGVAGGVRFLAERLASHGWVTIAPEHEGNTFSDGFPSFSEVPPTAEMIHRPQDMTAALDAVAAEGLLAGPLNVAAVGLSGHSRGAYTAWASAGGTFDAQAVAAACAGENGAFGTGSCTPEEEAVFLSGDLADPRFKATTLLDGSIRRDLFGDTGHQGAQTPFLSLSRDNEGSAEQFDTVDGLDFTWLAVEGSCHETFNLGVEAATLEACETFDVDRGWELTATYTFAFLRHHLLGDVSAETVGILDGSTEVDPAVVYHHRDP